MVLKYFLSLRPCFLEPSQYPKLADFLVHLMTELVVRIHPLLQGSDEELPLLRVDQI